MPWERVHRVPIEQREKPGRRRPHQQDPGLCAPAGTVITLGIDNWTVGTATVTSSGSYFVDVLPRIGLSCTGKTVTFNIGAGVAAQGATFAARIVRALHLSR